MPRRGRRINKYRKKAILAKRKRYRDRQQKFKLSTIKRIAKEAATQDAEVKHIEVLHDAGNHDTRIINFPLAHPQRINALATMPRPLRMKLFDNDSISQGITNTQRIGSQVFLKGIRIKLEILGPLNIGQQTGSIGPPMQWIDVYYMVVRQNKGTIPALATMKHSWWENSAIHNKKYVGTATHQRPDAILFQGVYKIRPRSDLSLATTGQVNYTTSNQPSKRIDRYISINRKYNIVSTALPNPQSYWLLVYCYAQRQGYSTVSGNYTNTDTNVNLGAIQLYNPTLNYKYVIYYTDG